MLFPVKFRNMHVALRDNVQQTVAQFVLLILINPINVTAGQDETRREDKRL